MHKAEVVILTLVTADTDGVSAVASLVGRMFCSEQAMDSARSSPHGAHYHADIIYLLP